MHYFGHDHSAVKPLNVINHIQNKSFCLHNICVCTVYIYYVYVNTHTSVSVVTCICLSYNLFHK